MKIYCDMNDVIWSAYEMLKFIQKASAYVWMVHREIYDILAKNLSIMMKV